MIMYHMFRKAQKKQPRQPNQSLSNFVITAVHDLGQWSFQRPPRQNQYWSISWWGKLTLALTVNEQLILILAKPLVLKSI